jgi:hypothetical protein
MGVSEGQEIMAVALFIFRCSQCCVGVVISELTNREGHFLVDRSLCACHLMHAEGTPRRVECEKVQEQSEEGLHCSPQKRIV